MTYIEQLISESEQVLLLNFSFVSRWQMNNNHSFLPWTEIYLKYLEYRRGMKLKWKLQRCFLEVDGIPLPQNPEGHYHFFAYASKSFSEEVTAIAKWKSRSDVSKLDDECSLCCWPSSSITTTVSSNTGKVLRWWPLKTILDNFSHSMPLRGSTPSKMTQRMKPTWEWPIQLIIEHMFLT